MDKPVISRQLSVTAASLTGQLKIDRWGRTVAFLLMAIAILLAACGQSADVEAPTESNADVPSDFALMSLDGDEVVLSELEGKYVLVNFWATWCIPCRKEMPYLQEVFEEHEDQLTVLAINMNEDAERVRPFIEEFGYTYPILLDPPDELAAEHNVRGLPVSFIVGPDGEIVYRRIGEILPEEFDIWLAENISS